MTTRVLVVEDEPDLAQILVDYLKRDGFAASTQADGLLAMKELQRTQPDLLLLDLMLPGMDGLAILRELRKNSSIPVIVVTAKVEEIDRLIGLELGADDYVSKPFSPREVVARVKAILRRARKTTEKTEPFKVGKFTVDTAGYSVSADGTTLDLTPTEYKIFELLASRPGQVFTRFQMVEQVQGVAFEGYERTIDAHVKNLRRKIDDNPKDPRIIQTVYGVGYKFSGESHA